jgi:hypothetical protein
MSLSQKENEAMNEFWQCDDCNAGIHGVTPCKDHEKLYEEVIEKKKEDADWPFGFEMKVHGTIYAQDKEEAREKLGEELDIDGDGRRDYIETEFLEGGPD